MTFAIRVENLSKKFALSLRRAMIYGLVDIARAALIPHRFRSDGLAARVSDAGRSEPLAPSPPDTPPPTGASVLRPTEFWALKDVSFQVKQGECVGVCGHNGAGKSTLFSILSGIYGPTTGRVEIHGKLQALIALGAGFHPTLSGRENIYINAAILGMSTRQIESMIDSIIDFAELHQFIDAPVKNYSSGMLVRLGFSVAAHLDPEVLLIDEVLAVGDSRFQAKCQDFISELMNKGKAIMLVSHQMNNIQGMCSRAIWLNRGELMAEGDVYEVTGAYQKHLFSTNLIEDPKAKESSGGFSAYIKSLDAWNPDHPDNPVIDAQKPVCVQLSLHSHIAYDQARPYVVLFHGYRVISILEASMLLDGHSVAITAGDNRIRVLFDRLPVKSGSYRFYACMRSRDGISVISNGQFSKRYEVANHAPACHNGAGDLPVIEGVTVTPGVVGYRWDLEQPDHA